MKITFNILGYEFNFEIVKKEKFAVVVDHAQRENDVQAIKESETFKNIAQQARIYREMRELKG